MQSRNYLKLSLILITLATVSCTPKKEPDSNIITVSIAPLAYVVDQIVGTDFEVVTLVPSGASPETFEPSVNQMKKVTNSIAYLNIGLIDFEIHLSEAIRSNSKTRIIDLKNCVKLIDVEDSSGHHESHSHSHAGLSGADPHIWSSPKNMKLIAGQIFNFIDEKYPDSTKYKQNYNLLVANLDSLDADIQSIAGTAGQSFLIYHPALSYLCEEYGFNQIAIENEGKEPSVEQMKSLIQKVKELNINKILYQSQFSKTSVEALSRELQIEAIPIDPLAYNYIDNTLEMCKLITQ